MIDEMMGEISREMFLGAAVAHVTGWSGDKAGQLACLRGIPLDAQHAGVCAFRLVRNCSTAASTYGTPDSPSTPPASIHLLPRRLS